MVMERQIVEILKPFRLTWKNRSTSDLIWAVKLVAEDTDRICAVHKEVYAVIAKARRCTWRGIESNIRRGMEQAWKHDRRYMETLAGNPLDRCPTAAEFIYICARAVIRQNAENDTVSVT